MATAVRPIELSEEYHQSLFSPITVWLTTTDHKLIGIMSEIIPVFSRKPIFGYESMVLALFGIVFLSMGVWAHHMFTVGLNIYLETFFMAATMAIAVPTGVKFFNWLATAWDGAIEFNTPMKFAFGFLATFLIGG